MDNQRHVRNMLEDLNLYRAEPSGNSRQFVGQVEDGGNMPTEDLHYFLVKPLDLSASEQEGASSSVVLSSQSVAVAMIRGVPSSGDLVMCFHAGGRWVSELGGGPALTTCGTECQSCGGVVLDFENGTVTDSNGTASFSDADKIIPGPIPGYSGYLTFNVSHLNIQSVFGCYGQDLPYTLAYRYLFSCTNDGSGDVQLIVYSPGTDSPYVGLPGPPGHMNVWYFCDGVVCCAGYIGVFNFQPGFTVRTDGAGYNTPTAWVSRVSPVCTESGLEAEFSFEPYLGVDPPAFSATVSIPFAIPKAQECCSPVPIPAKPLTFTRVESGTTVETGTLLYDSANHQWTDGSTTLLCYSGALFLRAMALGSLYGWDLSTASDDPFHAEFVLGYRTIYVDE